MITMYRDNRIVPFVLIALALFFFYTLLDGSVNNGGGFGTLPVWLQPERTGPLSQQADQTGEVPISNGKPSKIPATASTGLTASSKQLAADDVLLIMKTGATVFWRRLPTHILTTLSPSRISNNNTVLYSDYAETIGPYTAIDILSSPHISKKAKEASEFQTYNQLADNYESNIYFESNNLPGDDLGPAGGWRLDKWKFLPLIKHAGENWPKAKWYIYMEDDTYLFLPNVLHYLSSFDYSLPHYLGRFAYKGGIAFAHGGSGFALSRGAWEKSFGKDPALVTSFEKFTNEHCCGDHILGAALNSHGIKFGENGGDEKFSWGWNDDIHWKIFFGRTNWCRKIMSWHKVHNRDLAMYDAFEKAWDWEKGPMLFRDHFDAFIAPHLRKRVEWWDNLSSQFTIESLTVKDSAKPEGRFDEGLWNKSWRSVDACESACMSWVDCVQWSYYEDKCKMDDRVTLGSGSPISQDRRKQALMTTSGWLKERVSGWLCDEES